MKKNNISVSTAVIANSGAAGGKLSHGICNICSFRERRRRYD